MTKTEEIKAIVREAAESEFKDIPRTDHAFSERFERRMKMLFRARSSPLWWFVGTALGRAALVFLIISMLFAAACAVPPVRKALFDLEEGMRIGHVVFNMPDDEPAPHEFGFTELPEGFRLITEIRKPNEFFGRYRDQIGRDMVIEAVPAKTVWAGMDTSHGTIRTYELDGKEILVSYDEERTFAAWVEDGWFFELYYPVSASEDLMLEVLRKLK